MSQRNPPFDLFLSYNRLDKALVEPLAEALRERGLELFKDDWYLRPGEPWPAALEQHISTSRAIAVTIGRDGLGSWQQREAIAALERQSREAKAGNAFPVIPVLLARENEQQAGLAFLLQNTWVEGWDPRAADLIAGAVQGRAPAELYDITHPDPRSRLCPYRGLGVFREEDAGFYFGREPDLARLGELSEAGQAAVRRLADQRLLVTSRDWGSGDELVEVAHEALLRHWPKLEEWIDVRRSALLTLRQLQSDSRNWLAKGKHPSYLWSHERVREAAAALEQLGTEVVLSDEEREFLGPIDQRTMLAELEPPETTHRRRALIGERLDALGDPCPGIGVAATDGTPEIDWCGVPGGEVSIEVERRFFKGTKPRPKQIQPP